jgi:hypothetical protein
MLKQNLRNAGRRVEAEIRKEEDDLQTQLTELNAGEEVLHSFDGSFRLSASVLLRYCRCQYCYVS